jgi:hypothetical protein
MAYMMGEPRKFVAHKLTVFRTLSRNTADGLYSRQDIPTLTKRESCKRTRDQPHCLMVYGTVSSPALVVIFSLRRTGRGLTVQRGGTALDPEISCRSTVRPGSAATSVFRKIPASP